MRLITGVILAALAMAGLSHAQKRGGEEVYAQLCVGCHGPDGKADTDMGKQVKAADLTASAVQQQGDSDLAKVVKTGKGKMPAWGDKLSDDEIKSVVAYVKELGKAK